MKKVLVIFLAVMLLTSVSYGAVVATRISGSTVSFSTVSNANNRHGSVVTFNSVTNHIILTNLSTIADCYADLRCVDANGNHGYLTRKSAVVLLTAVGKATPNTVTVDFATKNIGFTSDTNDVTSDGGVSGSNQRVNYIVTGEVGDL